MSMSLLNRKMQLTLGSTIMTLVVVGTISYRSMVVSRESARPVSRTHHAGLISGVQDQTAIRYLTLDNPEQQRQISVLESLTAQSIQDAKLLMSLHRARGPAVDAIRNADTNQRLSQARTFLIFGTVLGLLI